MYVYARADKQVNHAIALSAVICSLSSLELQIRVCMVVLWHILEYFQDSGIMVYFCVLFVLF